MSSYNKEQLEKGIEVEMEHTSNPNQAKEIAKDHLEESKDFKDNWALASDSLKEAEAIARKITYFDLSADPGYMDEYVAALFFPHTDLSKFPSVKKGLA
jgi:hypothetical protein